MKTRLCFVAKLSGYERRAVDFNERDLSRGLYRPLCKRRPVDGGGDAVLLPSESGFSDDYEMNDLPCTDYERGYMI